MADVFLSYARANIGVDEKLAQLLANSGPTSGGIGVSSPAMISTS
jgi:hypothetical protein